MFAEPRFTPVTCGCVAGATALAAIWTVLGEIEIVDVLLLAKVTVTPPVGAGVDKVMGNGTDCVSDTASPEGVPIEPGGVTVRVSVALGIFGEEPAVIVVLPAATPVTANVVEVAPAANVTVAGTVATPVLLEVRLTVTPPVGAAADSVRVEFMLAVAATETAVGLKVTAAVTDTGCVAAIYPGAVAVMLADPTFTPLT